MELNKITFTNIILDNLNNSISENGKVDLEHFINLTNNTYEAINYSQCCCKENYIFKKGDRVVYNGTFEAKVLVNEKNKLVQIQTATSLPTTVNKRNLKLR